jgi:putative transposase
MSNNSAGAYRDISRPNRRSIRLRGYDYARAGAYFVTICVQNRECLFGDVVDGQMVLNDAGRMVQTVWDELPEYYPGVETDAFQIMPNHIHGIIVLVGAGPRACPIDVESACPIDVESACPIDVESRESGQPQGVEIGQPQGVEIGQPQGVAPTLSLPDVVHRFKTMTTKRYADGVKETGWSPFPGRLWQRNYYEHIIRNEDELDRIQEYIVVNPTRWESDRENPNATDLARRGTACRAPKMP